MHMTGYVDECAICDCGNEFKYAGWMVGMDRSEKDDMTVLLRIDQANPQSLYNFKFLSIIYELLAILQSRTS